MSFFLTPVPDDDKQHHITTFLCSLGGGELMFCNPEGTFSLSLHELT